MTWWGRGRLRRASPRRPTRTRGRAASKILVTTFATVTLLGSLVPVGADAVGASVTSRASSVHVNPVSVSFGSLRAGWVLGTTPCEVDQSCVTMERTVNHGRTWSRVALPAPLRAAANHRVGGSSASNDGASLGVYFANATDGWIYGSLAASTAQAGQVTRPVLWSTHDGGRHWARQSLPWANGGQPLLDLAAANGTVYTMSMNASYHVVLASSPVSVDHWHVVRTPTLGVPAGGGELQGAIVLRGRDGWIVEGNDRGVSGSVHLSQRGDWVRWTPPCQAVGNSFAVPVPVTSNARDLTTVCFIGGYGDSPSPSAPPGAAVGSGWLYDSRDAGARFVAGRELRPVKAMMDFAFNAGYGVLAVPTPATYLISQEVGNAQELKASFDGGTRWSVVYKGQLLSLAFTSVEQGVGIATTVDGEHSLIMTVNGGRDWITSTL